MYDILSSRGDAILFLFNFVLDFSSDFVLILRINNIAVILENYSFTLFITVTFVLQ